MNDIKSRVEFLKKADIAYEEGEPIVDDEIYDTLKEELLGLAPENEYFKNVGGLDKADKNWQKEHTHKYPMGSLFKNKSPELAEGWLSKTYPDTNGLSLVLEVKLDGSSICAIYNDGKLDKIATRGNGVIGKISEVAKYISSIPHKISEKGYVEIKGECVKDKKSFYEIWAPKGFNDPRSFVPGTINSKPDENSAQMMKERSLTFIAYEIRGKEFKTETDKMKFLESNGFLTLKSSTRKIDCTGRTHKEIIGAIKKYMESINRATFEFQLDGIVIKNNSVEASEELGVTNLRPKGSRAVKFASEQGETIAKDIIFQTGKSGVVCPVAILEPIFLSGATLTKSTLHNIKEIVRLGIDKLPYKVIVIRSNDIIPKIIKGVGPEANAKKFVIPDNCPCCNFELIWDKTETNKVCLNPTCPAQISGRIDYHLKVFNVKNIGESTIDTLIEKGYVSCISDMYGLKKHTKELSEVFGDRAFERILEAMDSVKEVTLASFVTSLSIANIGTMAKLLTAVYPTIEDIDGLKAEDIQAIDGFGPVKAKNMVTQWLKMRPEITKLLTYIKIKAKEANVSNKLSGKSFCITGTLSRPRGDFQKIVEANGGKISSSVSKNLDFLLMGSDAGSKEDKAKTLGVKIISESDLEKMLK